MIEKVNMPVCREDWNHPELVNKINELVEAVNAMMPRKIEEELRSRRRAEEWEREDRYR